MTLAEGDILGFEAGPRLDFDLDTPLDGHVAAQVARTPDAIALSDGERRCSYAQMWRRAGAFAALLARKGVRRGDVVAVCAERSVDLPIALLAILRVGAAYCPLEPDQPARRLRHALEQARPAAIVCAPTWRALLVEAATGLGCVRPLVVGEGGSLSPLGGLAGSEQGRGHAWSQRAFDPRDGAYLIFTSGSTGRPKGVLVPHRGVVNRLLWMQHAFGLGAEDTVLQKTPYGFDVSVWELFWPLLAGARLHLAAPDAHLDPRQLAECILSERVTTVHFVPSMLSLFLEDPMAGECSGLRRVLCSGEALAAPLMERALKAFAPASLWNLYGPTEASIDVTCWRCRPLAPGEAPPIGRPIANVSCMVLDEDGERVPPGAAGELCLAGVQVALGYVGQPQLTAERFVELAHTPGPIYRTGDVARWRSDGELECLGRTDGQVKLGGVRIELGEIEAVICRLPEVVGAAVIVREDLGAARRLVAYVVVREPIEPAEIRRRLAESLPRRMIPAFLMLLPRLPTTASGKLDRAALPRPPLPGVAARCAAAPAPPQAGVAGR